MAAPYVAAKGTASAVTTGASTPTYPAGIAANDIVFLLAISHQPNGIGVIDTPANFTEVAQATYKDSSAVDGGRAALFWRRASGSLTGTVSVTRTGDTGTDGVFFSQLYRVVGAKTSGDPWDAATTDFGNGNATVDVPSVTVSGAERTLLAFIAQADNASTVDPPTNYVGLETDTTATGTDAELRLVHRRNIDATIGGSATTATGGETEGWAVFHLSMIPASTYSAPSVVLTGDAIRFDGAQDVVKLDPVDSTGVRFLTFTGWAKISVDRNNYSTVFCMEDGAGHSTAYNELITDSDGTTLSVYDHVTGDIANVQAMTVGTWYAFGFKVTSGAWKSYVGTQGFSSLTTATGSLTNILFNDLTGIGSTTFTATETFNGMFSMCRVWSAALSDAEIKAELESSRPVRINDLIGAWFPLGVGSGTELDATYGNDLVSRGVGTPDWTFAAGPVLPAIGTSAVTLGNTTSAASGTVGGGTVTGTSAVTLSNSTAAGTGLVVPVGASAVTLSVTTATATGAHGAAGTSAVTLAATTATGTGQLTPQGTSAVTLSATTATGTGLVVPVGTSVATLADSAATGSATHSTAGTSSVTLAASSATGVGQLTPQGISSVALTPTAATGTGQLVPQGTSAVTLGDSTGTGTGVHSVAGSSAVTLEASTATGAGQLTPQGTSAVTLANSTATGTAVAGDNVAGTSAIALANSTATGSGTHSQAGTSAVTLAATTATGVGQLTPQGTSAVTLSASTATGSGTFIEGVGGTSAVALSNSTATGSATHSITGSSAVQFAGATAIGSGWLVPRGISTVTLSASTATGSGAQVEVGSISVSLGNSTATGVGLFITGIAGSSTVQLGATIATGTSIYGVPPHYALPGERAGLAVVQATSGVSVVQTSAEVTAS